MPRIFRVARDRSPDAIETGLTFLGLVAMMDPPREEAAQAVADCLTAGIVPVMITGDHPATARSIARRLGIADEHDRVMTGRELGKLSDEEFSEQVRGLRIYARGSQTKNSYCQSIAGARRVRCHDRRWRQRCARAEKCRYRRGHG
ncbi:MAG: HAD family hydrolase [Burkholderiales bacterium]|nr:HAD family hydrolase [Burkholderiales bacterium]